MRIISLVTITFAFTGCSTVKMSDVVNCSKDSDLGQLVISDKNTGFAPILDAKSVVSGKAEVVGVQVYNGDAAKAKKKECRSHCNVGNAFNLGSSSFGYGGGHATSFAGNGSGVGGFHGILPGIFGHGGGFLNQVNMFPPVVLNTGSVFNTGVNCHSSASACGPCGGGHATATAKKITAPVVVEQSAKYVIGEQRNYEIQK